MDTDVVLDATDLLMRQVGVAKLSMSDVARSAGVSRGTLYRYFDSREALLDALSQRAADRFFADAVAVMDPQPTLAARLGVLSELMVRTVAPDTDTQHTAMVRMLATEGAHALRRTARLLRPYLEDARVAGEVRADLDVADASEWLARIILSFTVFQASIAEPSAVASFVRRYAIDGLTRPLIA